jgi:hypothetical protein
MFPEPSFDLLRKHRRWDGAGCYVPLKIKQGASSHLRTLFDQEHINDEILSRAGLITGIICFLSKLNMFTLISV